MPSILNEALEWLDPQKATYIAGLRKAGMPEE
jgi:hypothetical protein